MDFREIGALFVTTFLGAFLAFGLENFRERRRLIRWVRQHFGHLREMSSRESETASAIVDDLLGRTIAVCDVWMTATKPDELTEDQWDLLGSTIIAHAPDFGAIVRSEALSVIPLDLAIALSWTESAAARMEGVSQQVQAAFDDLRDRWFERTTPLSIPDQRRLRRYRDSVVELREAVDGIREPLGTLVTGIDAWGG